MSELTIQEVQDLINTTVSGLAGRQDKQFKSLLSPIIEQLSGFTTYLEELKTKAAEPTTTSTSQTTPDPKIGVMERELKELKAARESDLAEKGKLQKENALSKALNSFTFANDISRDTAFKTFTGDIQVTSDGQYVIGDEPIDVAVKSRMSQLTGLLAPKQAGTGSGASPNSSNQSQGQNGMLTKIVPGMTKDQLQAAGAELQKFLQS